VNAIIEVTSNGVPLHTCRYGWYGTATSQRREGDVLMSDAEADAEKVNARNVSEGSGAQGMSHREDSNSKPFAISPKGQLTRPPTQDDQGDQHAAEAGKERENKPLLSASNIVSVFALAVSVLTLFFSLYQSHREEISQQRTEILEYTGKIATLAADHSGANHTFEISARR
jgi:hypothetical protein